MTLPRQLIAAIDRWAKQETKKRLGARVSRSQAVAELCQFAFAQEQSSLATYGNQRSLRVYRLGKEPPDDETTANLSAGARVALVSELSLAAYQMRGQDVDRGIHRDVVNLARRKS